MTRSALLKKFFENRCSPPEAEEAMRYLQEEPWLVEEYLSADDWEQSRDLIPLPASDKIEIFKNIQKLTAPKPILRRLRPVLAMAAALGGLIFALIYLYSINRPTAEPVLVSAVGEKSIEEQFFNSGTAVELIELPDNSVIRLYPGSSVRYQKAFTGNRSIFLAGRAEFDVRKNPSSPFVVTAGSVSTTALGTRFLVDNSSLDHQVNVKLYEGRVLVKPVDDQLMMAETFLEAGQECYVDLLARQVRVNLLYLVKTEQKLPAVQMIAEAELENNSFDRIQFIKAPIPEVLEKLELLFKKEIDFEEKDLQGNFFTGEFSSVDSLAMILAVLSGMNELKFFAEGDKILVKKSEPRLSVEKAAGRTAKIASPDMALRMGIDELRPPGIPVSLVSTFSLNQEEQPLQYSFQSVSLPEIFDQLQKQTFRKIVFDRQDLSSLYFTGELTEGESVKNNLQLICQLNGLTLTINRKNFEITREP